MKERFEGVENPLRLEAIAEQVIVGGNETLARDIDRLGKLVEFNAGTAFIQQDAEDNDVYLILAGVCDIVINGRTIGHRSARQTVGEMAAVQPTQRRSATCVAADDLVALRLTERDFTALASSNPEIYRAVARELSRRLLDRNASIGAFREKIRVFIISSVEALPVARVIQNALEHDVLPVLWTDGVFKVASYPLQDLEDQVEDSDFAIAVAHADDFTKSRGKDWPSPRDNVIFELGLFMGKLGKKRAILMEPREGDVKLPSDLTGITTIPYKYKPGKDAIALMAPACNRLRDHIKEWGANNG